MNLLLKDTDYAVQALIYIAIKDGALVSSRELQDKLGLPRPFLRKILQKLQKKEILTSIKGNNGGFKLQRPAKQIKLTEIMGVFQGEFNLSECMVKKMECPNRVRCSLRKKIKSIEALVNNELKDTTIASLIKR